MKKLFVLPFFLFPLVTFSQTIDLVDTVRQNQIDTITKPSTTNVSKIEIPSNAIYIDLFGRYKYYALNYEFRPYNLIATSIGIGIDDNLNLYSALSFLPGTGRHRFESQIGLGYSHGYSFIFHYPVSDAFRIFTDCGYRYQSKNGFLFRGFIGVGMGLYSQRSLKKFLFNPVLGLSLGYSF